MSLLIFSHNAARDELFNTRVWRKLRIFRFKFNVRYLRLDKQSLQHDLFLLVLFSSRLSI